jgi:predicted site-specific integrase-resolvase
MKLVSRKELAKHLNIGTITLAKWEKAGLIKPKIKVNFKTIRYDLDEVVAALSRVGN